MAWAACIALTVANLLGTESVDAASCNPAVEPSAQDLVRRETGIVYQPATGLEWRQCAYGTFAYGAACHGTPAALGWRDANEAARQDGLAGGGWRVPNLKELLALVEVQCSNPALDPVLFADAPGGDHWTSTGTADGTSAYRVDLSEGYRYQLVDTGTLALVRLVRGGRLGGGFQPGGSTPLGLAFPDRYWALPGETVDSQPYVVYGVGQPLLAVMESCSALACSFGVNGGPFSADLREVRSGDTIELRQQASASAGGVVEARFRIGSASTTWRVYTTGHVVIPNASPLPGKTQGIWYSLLIEAANGTPPVTFAHVGGGLPPGISIASNGLLSGTPTSAGNYTFDLKATDSASPPTSSTRTFTQTINPPLSIATTSLPDGTRNVPYGTTIVAAGGTPPVTFQQSGSLPPYLYLDMWGTVRGTPVVSGSFPFVVYATDVAGAVASRGYTLRVLSPSDVVLTTSASPVPAGAPFLLTATVGAADVSPTGVVSFRDGNAPLPGCTAVPLAPESIYTAHAICSVAGGLSVGTHTLWADYAGGSAWLPASGSVQQVVIPLAGLPCAGFTDVDAASPFCASVEWMHNRLVTSGCAVGRYCPDAEVTRLSMAAFLARLGSRLADGVTDIEESPGALDLGTTPIVCTTGGLPASTAPAAATIDAVVRALATGPGSVSVQIVRRLSGSGVWQTASGGGQRASLQANRWTNARVLGHLDVEAGQVVEYGVRLTGDGAGLASLADSSCHLLVRTGNRNPSYSPFDSPR